MAFERSRRVQVRGNRVKVRTLLRRSGLLGRFVVSETVAGVFVVRLRDGQQAVGLPVAFDGAAIKFECVPESVRKVGR